MKIAEDKRKDLWQSIRQEVQESSDKEPVFARFLDSAVLCHGSLAEVLAFHLADKLASSMMDAPALYEIFLSILCADKGMMHSVEEDILAYYQRDPACQRYCLPLLYYKGFHAIQIHRINHALWQNQQEMLAFFFQNRASQVFGVDIHPAVRMGSGIMCDHGTGLVIGETSVLGNNISLLHGVTLGGSGKEEGDRHPKIHDGVMIGAHASILGNVAVGECARVGAGSVVTSSVPAHATVVGVPARVVGEETRIPAKEMDQKLD